MNTARSEWSVPDDHPALEGHFPGRPILPGVVWLEQALRLARTELEFRTEDCRFSRVKFLQTAAPGDPVLIEVSENSGGFDFSILGPTGLIARGQCRPAS